MKKVCQFIFLKTNKYKFRQFNRNIYVSHYVDDYFIEGINSFDRKI